MVSRKEIKRAAAMLGRRGGRKKSEQKAHAARETGRAVGGRKAVDSFNPATDGVRDGGVSILGFRTAGGEKELRQKGQFYRSRSGRPLYSEGDHPVLRGEAAEYSTADLFERLLPFVEGKPVDTSAGRVLRMLCPTCGKVQFFFFQKLLPGYLEGSAPCRDCAKEAKR
jgi:hypothetical protein